MNEKQNNQNLSISDLPMFFQAVLITIFVFSNLILSLPRLLEASTFLMLMTMNILIIGWDIGH
jgi:hypothetical protein